MRAYGGVEANVLLGKEEEKGKKAKADKSDPADEVEAEEESGQAISLSGQVLVINKNNQLMRITSKAKSSFEGMLISGDQITYHLDENDALLDFVASKNVRIDLDGKQINGDKADFDVKEKVLTVTGKIVKYLEEGKLEGEYSRLVYDTNNGSMAFYARDDQLVKTIISN